MNRVKVTIEASTVVIVTPDKVLSPLFDFKPAEKQHRTEGLESVPAYYGKYKIAGRTEFDSILSRLNNVGNFKPWKLEDGRYLLTSGAIGNRKFIVELHANYIVIYDVSE